MTTPAERIAAYELEQARLRAEEARLLEIVMAPQHLGEVRSRMVQLDGARQRAEAEALADAAAPGWRDTLAAREAELRLATAEAERRDWDATMKARAEVVPEGTEVGLGRIGHVGPGLAGMTPPESADPERALAHMKRRIAQRRVRAVASFPARIAAAARAPQEPAKVKGK